MASTQTAVSDGTLSTLPLSIDYFERSEISVYLDDVYAPLTEWAWVGTTDRTITFTPTLTVGRTVKVVRNTLATGLRHTFSEGAQFRPSVLDDNFVQLLRLILENGIGADPDNSAILAAIYGAFAAPGGSLLSGYSAGSGVGMVATTVQAQLRGWLNVKSFNVLGNGTDETTNIQKALTHLGTIGGGTLWFPEGTYGVVAPEANYLWLTGASNRKNYAALLVPSNCTIRGMGAKSEIKLLSTPASPGTTDGRGDYATTHILVNAGAIGLPKTIVNRNIHVRDLKFNGNLVQQSGEGVSFCGVESFSVQHCEFTQSYYETNYFVYSRGGDYSFNHCYANGVYQIDGGGPMADSSHGINIHDNVITDSGYYAGLLIDSFNCGFYNNRIYAVNYASSSGYQAVRVSGCTLCDVSRNAITDSGYSAIWVHNGHTNSVENNIIVHAGYAAGGGSNIHGITVDHNVNFKGGRNTLHGNKVFLSNGAGIAVLESISNGSTLQENSGSIITKNTCVYNQRDGIAVLGKQHRVQGNTCESNGTSITDGIVGNGYNGIALNGATYCIVTDNSCSDITQAGTVNINLDAQNTTTVEPARSVTHASRTQNYGIVEYPADCREEIPTTATRSGLTVTVTKTAHTVVTGQMVHTYGGFPNDYNGYFTPTKLTANTWTYTLIGNPVTISSILTNGTKMIVTTGAHGLGIGEVWNLYISNGAGAGDWYATVLTATTSRLENMPNGYGVAGSTLGNYVQYLGDDHATTMIAYSPESLAAGHNIIKNNVLTQNLNNPTLGTGTGYKAYSKGVCVCGVGSTVSDNL